MGTEARTIADITDKSSSHSDSEKEVEDMEVPGPRLVYNGAQRRGAVVSDTEVMSNDEAVAMPDAMTTDRLVMSDITTLVIENEVSRHPMK